MANTSTDRIADYVRYLDENPQEVDLLFKELLIGVTSFFRDPATWDYVQGNVLPDLLPLIPDGAVLRAWVAGCSTGEEAFSLAICFCEILTRLQLPSVIPRYLRLILMRDAIDKARRSVYPANITADVSLKNASSVSLSRKVKVIGGQGNS